MFQFCNVIRRKNIIKTIEKDIDEAFFTLGMMYKKHPTYINIHNFGVLLSKYGNELSFFNQTNLDEAEKLLLQANAENECFITLKELGDLYLNKKKYGQAINFYTSALKYKITYCVCYNTAQCFYFLQDYMEMKNYLHQYLQRENFSNIELITLQELYGFACALSGDKQGAINMLNLLQKNNNYSNTPETLKLAYLCDDYSFIVQNYKEVFSEWMVEAIDYQVIYQAFHNISSELLGEFEIWTQEVIYDFYAKNPDFKPDEELIEVINSNVTPPIIKLTLNPAFSCDFY